MAYRTLAEFETDIRYRYDIEGFTARHPQANIIRLINDAYRSLRDRLTSDGSSIFVGMTEGTQVVTGRTSGYPGTLLTAAVFGAFEIVNEVHVQIGSHWLTLQHTSLADALTNTTDSQAGLPMAWCIAGLTAESGAVTGQSLNILITPPLDTARTFRVVGMKQWTELTTPSSDRILTDMGFGEFILASVGVDLAMRDDDVQLAGVRLQERERIYQDLKSRVKRRDPSPKQRVDVRTRRIGRW